MLLAVGGCTFVRVTSQQSPVSPGLLDSVGDVVELSDRLVARRLEQVRRGGRGELQEFHAAEAAAERGRQAKAIRSTLDGGLG